MSQQYWPNSHQENQTIDSQKLQANGFSMAKSVHARRSRFDFDNIIGSPFFLTTFSIAAIGWMVAFISSIAANVQNSNFSHFAWWAITYQLFVVLGVITAVVYDSVENYRLALCALLASALSFTTSTANALIYSSAGAQEAAAAGHIFLSIVNVTWILYFGSTSDAAPHAWVDSYSINKGPAVPGGPRPMSHAAALYPSGRYGSPYPKSVIDGNLHSPTTNNVPPTPALTIDASTMNPRDTMNTMAVTELDFTYRAKAIYSYEANVEDPNEISFSKGEILEVADISGKWFQAKNARGEVGIAPSNYLTLVPTDS